MGIKSTEIYISVLLPEFRFEHRQVCNFIDVFMLLALGLQSSNINCVRLNVTDQLVFTFVYLLNLYIQNLKYLSMLPDILFE